MERACVSSAAPANAFISRFMTCTTMKFNTILKQYITAHSHEFLDDLIRLCRQPSISAQNAGIKECADTLGEMMKAAGLQVRQFTDHGGYPIVYGERLEAFTLPTLLFYNHYDVQPPEPLELWKTPPFSPSIRQAAIYARGVADDKGPLVARLCALKAVLATVGNLPVNVKFVVEGEEEIGSSTLPKFIRKHKTLLQAQGCIWENGYKDEKERPTIYLGAKGILYVELHAQNAAMDLHSAYATLVQNPAWRLVQALASIKNANEQILVDGFADDVVEPTPEERAYLKTLPLEEKAWKRKWRVNAFVNQVTGFETKLRHFYQPTANICGLVAGYTGQGSKTVLPNTASAKLDFRLVPNQSSRDVLHKLRRHLRARGFTDVEVKAESGYEPARTPLHHPLVQLVARTARQVYKTEPVVEPTMAASGPMYLFINELKLPTVSTGVGYAHSTTHAPNENIRVHDYLQGIDHIILIMQEYAQQA